MGIVFAHLGLPFAGEDFYNGLPWHHEEISEDALRAKGYGPDAIEEIGWNADFVDSYLYNPLWWIQGGLSRFKVAMAITPDLTKVHFDDNFSGDHIRRTWRRYLTGAMAGLVWAAERNDIAAGRNLIGVTFHAIQDFYSHSNWIDSPDRRELTWFEFEKAKRDVLAVYAGAYEHAAQTGVKHHGKIGPSCTLLRQPLVKPFLEPGCTAFSPLHNSRICELYDECKEGNPIQPNLFGLTVPGNVLYASPPGMNLDARWSANIGVRVRGLTDITGAKAFDTARGLAQKASEEWLEIVDEKLEKMGFGAYLNQLKKANDTTMKEKQYEEYHRFPFQFLSAGTYPPDLRTPEEEWYLRVQTRTGTDRGAGTDSDIYLEADGKRFLLDYLPRANPIIGYNDFESGDVGVYTVGPFAKLPEKITLFNNQAGGPEVARAIAQSAIDSVRSLADTVGSALLSLVAGHADRVGTNRQFWTAEQLAAIPAAGRVFGIQINGGDEGNYRIDGKITKTAESPAGAAEPWYEFRVQLTSLVCIRKGSVDRFTRTEEPYILSLLVPFPGNILKYKTSPFTNVTTGVSKRIGYTFPTVRIPKIHGMLSLPISLWESDSESETSRRQQLDKFADEAARRTGPARQGVLDAVGAAVAADWRIASLSVYAFNRGGHVLKTGTVHETSVNAWLKGKERREFPLAAARLKSYPAVDARTIDVLEAPKASPLGYGYDFNGEWNVQISVGGAFNLRPPIRTKIRLASNGNSVQGFYEGPPIDTQYLRLLPGKIYEGQVFEKLFEGAYLYDFKGTWTLGTTAAMREAFEVGESFSFDIATSLDDPNMKDLFLGMGPVLYQELKRQGQAEPTRVSGSVSLRRVNDPQAPGSALADRSQVELGGSWGYGNSHGGDYYRVQVVAGRIEVVLDREDRNHRELQVGDRVFEGTIQPDAADPNAWLIKGTALRRPFGGNAAPTRYETSGTVRIQKRREDGRLMAVLSFIRQYGDSSSPGEWVISRLLPRP